ncbi:Fc receptor-like A isoform X2 [Lepus europaeus]|uniref:Fc receptor-like A isoform X2 n=1 Tax=Lepus europaeus TaxID=9983 RepID=UPI002B45C858|nr:Fc receptor-like A isoform X2 [Lepus europaeus]
MKLGSVFMSWTLYLSPVMLWAALTLLAANLETLQCDGPISTRESSCHTDADPRDDDYEIKAYTFSEPFHLIVSYELFPAPVLQAAPSGPQDGSLMTLSCQTKLPPQKSATRLLFSFYKDGKPMRSRGRSSEFQIPITAEEHSGTYWCEAATEDNQVQKQSPQLEMRVHAPSGSAAPPTLNPAPQKSAAPETTPTEPPGPPPPQPTPASEDSGFSSPLRAPDPHLYHRMGLLLQHIQDVRALLGHLVIELRDLSGHLKPGATKAPAK